MVHPGTLFHRRQRGIRMHSYENRGQIRALRGTAATRHAALPRSACWPLADHQISRRRRTTMVVVVTGDPLALVINREGLDYPIESAL
jgi:hypothetical protein